MAWAYDLLVTQSKILRLLESDLSVSRYGGHPPCTKMVNCCLGVKEELYEKGKKKY